MKPAFVLSVKTPMLTVMGSAGSLGVILALYLAWHGAWLGAFACATIFGCSGVGLLLMSARITADESGITVRKLLGERHARWEQIAGVEMGGGNLVIRLRPQGRIVAPSLEFWSGCERSALIQFMGAKLAGFGIEAKASVRAVFQAGDR